MSKGKIVTSELTVDTQEYKNFFEQIKKRIHDSQFKASLAVNNELVTLYWSVGSSIVEKQKKEGWGTKVIERLSKDLAAEFPGVSGFSSRNLKYMRKFAEAYRF
jgi:predicted nuclease of restriction endonuclease-like (RecB) superfamily